MLQQLRKFAPFAAVVGYVTVYTTKGYDRILTDLQNITPEKLMAKWQNFAIAAVAVAVVSFVPKLKIPAIMKTAIVVALYFVAGHQLATAIDPPNGVRGGSNVRYTVPRSYNPYSYGGR